MGTKAKAEREIVMVKKQPEWKNQLKTTIVKWIGSKTVD